MTQNPLRMAMVTLSVFDIYCLEGRFQSAPNFKFEDFADIKAQTRNEVKQAMVMQLETGQKLLRVRMDMAVRWLAKDEITEKALVEAVFAAEYLFSGELEKASIDAFALNVVPHHIWPYWREYIASQSTRMSLPKLTIPLAVPGISETAWPPVK